MRLFAGYGESGRPVSPSQLLPVRTDVKLHLSAPAGNFIFRDRFTRSTSLSMDLLVEQAS